MAHMTEKELAWAVSTQKKFAAAYHDEKRWLCAIDENHVHLTPSCFFDTFINYKLSDHGNGYTAAEAVYDDVTFFTLIDKRDYETFVEGKENG